MQAGKGYFNIRFRGQIKRFDSFILLIFRKDVVNG